MSYTLAADNGTLHAFKGVGVTRQHGRFLAACGVVVSGTGYEVERYSFVEGDKPCRKCSSTRPEALPTVTA